MPKSVARTLFLGVFGKGASIAAAALTTKLLSYSLGPHAYGQFATAMALVAVFALLTDIGTNAITPREIARRPSDAGAILAVNLGLRSVLTAASLIIANVVAAALYDWNVERVTAITSLSLAFQAAQAVMSAYLYADVRGHVVAFAALLQQLAALGGSALVWLVFGPNLVAFACVYSAAVAVSSVVVWFAVPPTLRLRPTYGWGPMRDTLRMSVAIGLIQILDVIYLKVDTMLLASLRGSDAAGRYAICYSVVLAVAVVPGVVMSSFSTSIVRSEGSDTVAHIRRAAHATGFGVGLLVALVIPVAAAVLSVLSSAGYVEASPALITLLAASVVSAQQYVLGTACVARDVHTRLLWVSAACLVANVVLNLIAIRAWGTTGAATATALTECLSYGLTARAFERLTGLRPELLRRSLPFVASLGAAVGAGLGIDELGPHHWAPLARIAVVDAVVVATYLAMQALFGYHRLRAANGLRGRAVSLVMGAS